VTAIRSTLDPWLGEPKRRAGQGRFTLYYRFETTSVPVIEMRVKIEINTREHFSVHGLTTRPLAIDNPWFSGRADVPTYHLPELLGTKLRALYQRKKGRDLFDLAVALAQGAPEPAQVVEAFERYMAFGGTPITRAQFEANLAAKIADPTFLGDVPPLLRTGLTYDPTVAWQQVHKAFVNRLPGEPWRGDGGGC
jgi:hypothetical protein